MNTKTLTWYHSTDRRCPARLCNGHLPNIAVRLREPKTEQLRSVTVSRRRSNQHQHASHRYGPTLNFRVGTIILGQSIKRSRLGLSQNRQTRVFLFDLGPSLQIVTWPRPQCACPSGPSTLPAGGTRQASDWSLVKQHKIGTRRHRENGTSGPSDLGQGPP